VPIVRRFIMDNESDPFHKASAAITSVIQKSLPKKTGSSKHTIVNTAPSETALPKGRKRPP